MSSCLKIGDRRLDGDRLISALVQYQILETLVGQLLLDDVLEDVALSKQELVEALAPDSPMPEDFEEFLAQWCDRQQIASTYFNQVIVRQLRIEKLKQLFFANQVESEFLRSKPNFDQIEYSLIQTTNPALAQELYFQLRDDEADFGSLARQYSLGQERETNGWVGPVALSSLPVEVTNLLHSTPRGVVCSPVAVGDRVWIVRLERLMAAHLTHTTRANVINQMYTQWLQAKVKALIATPGAIAVESIAAAPTAIALPAHTALIEE